MSNEEKDEKKKKGFFDKLTDLVLEPSDEKSEAESDSQIPVNGAEEKTAAPVVASTETSYVSPTAANAEQVDELRRKVRERGRILTDFLVTVEDLKETIPNEAQRFMAIDKARKDFGPDDLLAAASEQLAEISAQKAEFDEAAMEVIGEAGILEKDVASIITEIDNLRQRITQLEEKKRETSAKARSARSKAETGKAKFEAASRIVQNELEEIVRKINLHLKGGK